MEDTSSTIRAFRSSAPSPSPRPAASAAASMRGAEEGSSAAVLSRLSFAAPSSSEEAMGAASLLRL